MTAPPPRRPWWKRKRTWAAGLLWLGMVYPLSKGPSFYCFVKGWHSGEVHLALYRPLGWAIRPFPKARRAIWEYQMWWGRLALSDPPSE